MFRIYQIAIFLMVLSISSTTAASIKFSERLHEYSLENGLKVILIEDKRSPAVINSIWYRVGSSDEVKGKTGISHILEHMMFKGTNKLGPGEFSSKVKEMGGTDNAFTSKDYTGYFQKVHQEDLERCIELESDRMVNLKLDEKQIAKEIKVVKEERRLRTDDNPISKTFEKIMINAFGMNNYGIPIIGTMQDIEDTTKEDLQSWYDSYYQPRNAIVIIAGNFDKTEAIKYIKKYYGSIENNKSLNLKKSRADFSSRDFFTIQEDVTKPVVFISFKKPKYSDEKQRELYALDLFIEIMDGGYSSRLTENLVNSKKVALDTFISNDTYNQHDSLIIIGGTPRGDVTPDEFKAYMLDEFSSDSIDSISQLELDSAKARIKSNSVLNLTRFFIKLCKLVC